MRIIPVVDLKGGLVVRGVGGRRDEYRPIRSRLVDDPAPASVAAAFARLGFREAYVADLDAIAGATPAYEAYAAISGAGLELWIDAGVSNAAQVERLNCRLAPRRMIVGLETLPSFDSLADLVEHARSEQLVFSLDLKGGRPLTRSVGRIGDPSATDGSPIRPTDFVDRAIGVGIRSVIVLDLTDVGGSRGVSTLDLCRAIRERHPSIELIAGGGVRGPDDLTALTSAGCDAALVASALHDGAILPDLS